MSSRGGRVLCNGRILLQAEEQYIRIAMSPWAKRGVCRMAGVLAMADAWRCRPLAVEQTAR